MSLIDVDNLKVYYPVRGGFWNRVVDNIKAVDGITLHIDAGKTLGLVGESGSGKSTTGKAIIGLEKPTSGSIHYNGVDVVNRKKQKLVHYNRDVQMIFQDAMSSLNPEHRIIDIIAEPLRNYTKMNKDEIRNKVIELLDIVGISADSLYKYPYQFSGGQRQRIDIARAVATNPSLIIADEPVSALDLSVQAQVLNFMKKIQKQFGISYLFISHDLGVVRHMCDELAIMNRGQLVEKGTRDDIFNHPLHIYTKRLLSAIPTVDVDHRDEHIAYRKKIEKIYQEQHDRYYQKDSRAYPLRQFSGTHFAALPESFQEGGEE